MIDFRMVYYNADGRESSMCGNGGRCIVAFAKLIGVIKKEAKFIAIDGPHSATCMDNGEVSLGMQDVSEVETIKRGQYFLNTGSPHYVVLVEEIPKHIVALAKEIRYNERFEKEGVNVNFVKVEDGDVSIRTYERGVEDETLACGTGSVAAAIVGNIVNGKESYKVHTLGGLLSVSFNRDYQKVMLTGPARLVFKGEYDSLGN